MEGTKKRAEIRGGSFGWQCTNKKKLLSVHQLVIVTSQQDWTVEIKLKTNKGAPLLQTSQKGSLNQDYEVTDSLETH